MTEDRSVEIHRDGLTDDPIYGYVTAVTKRWVALQVLTDAVYFDGHEAIRTRDITKVRFDRDPDYRDRAIAALGRPAPDFPLPDDARTADVLGAAAARADLIGVHEERYEGEPLLVGKLTRTGQKRFRLLFIGPGGIWDAEPRREPYSDVTRVSFGGRYYEALERFGDPLPTT